MRSLAATEVLKLWEAGRHQRPAHRALTVLGMGYPELSPDRLAMLEVGARDARLFAMREKTFGDALDVFVECPHCGRELQLTLSTEELLVEAVDAGGSVGAQQIEIADYSICFRLPNSGDLAAVTDVDDVEDARRMLATRCLLSTTHNGRPIPADGLPDPVVREVEQRIEALDPQADVVIDLHCPDCEHRWDAVFDIASFFWAELQSCAQRLLREVHVLAKAYGWSEPEILSLTPARRRRYLSMVC